MQTAVAFITGFFAGLVHVWSGPDHLAAVAPLCVGRQKRAWTSGVRWGLGHSAGVLVVGALSLWFRESLRLDALSSVAEHLVGIVLIALGIWGLRKAFRRQVHCHPHDHGGDSHTHFHVHDPDTAHPPGVQPAHVHTHAAFAIGSLHGIAGSSHFIGVLPALAFGSPVASAVYLLAYAIGTVTGMAGFSSVVGLLHKCRALGGADGYRRFMGACSTAALAIGIYWVL